MLSKGSVAILPLVLLVLLWWQIGKINPRDCARLVPFFTVAIVYTLVNIWFQTHGKAIAFRNAELAQRIAAGGAAIWFYLSKSLLPIDLLFIYPQWHVAVRSWPWWIPAISAVVAICLLWRVRNCLIPRAMGATAVLFCIALIPVLGIVDVGFMRFSFVADQYSQIALVVIVAAVSAGWCVWQRRPTIAWLPLFSAAAALCALIFLSHRQAEFYAGPIALYRSTLARNPSAWVLQNNLGETLLDTGELHEAQLRFENALALKEDYPDAHNNLGNCFLKLGRYDEAIAQYHAAISLKPDYAEQYANLAIAFSQSNHRTDAIESAKTAIEIARANGQLLLAKRIEAWLHSIVRTDDNAPPNPAGSQSP